MHVNSIGQRSDGILAVGIATAGQLSGLPTAIGFHHLLLKLTISKYTAVFEIFVSIF